MPHRDGDGRDTASRSTDHAACKCLDEQASMLAIIVEAAFDAIVTISPAGRIAQWNPAAQRIFGYTAEEAIGSDPYALLLPVRAREAAWRGFDHFRHTGDSPIVGKTIEMAALRKDGTEFPMEISSSGIPSSDGWWALAIIRDASERREINRLIDQRSKELTDYARMLTCLYRVSKVLDHTSPRDGKVLEEIVTIIRDRWDTGVNASVRLLLDDIVVEQGSCGHAGADSQAPIIANGRDYGRIELCFGDGLDAEHSMSIRASAQNLLDEVATRLGDAIERYTMYDEIASLNQRLEFILGATHTRLHLIRGDMTLAYVDPRTRQRYGEPGTKKCYEYFGDPHNVCAHCPIVTNDTFGKPTTTEVRPKDEPDKIYQRTSVAYVSDTDGLMYAEILVDVTETKTLESELSQSRKLEAVGQLAAGIAHEINTPTQFIGDNTRFLGEVFSDLREMLVILDGFVRQPDEHGAEALRTQVCTAIKEVDVDYLREEVPNAIEQSLEGVERVAAIVRAMKEFSHPSSAEKQSVDLTRAVKSTLVVSRNEWKYVAKVVTDYADDLPPVPCFPSELNQAILNIIINAAQAIGEVVDKDAEEKGTITVVVRREGEWAEIRISDTGPGIPLDVRPHVFDHFFTTKEVGKGTGQGLSIAHDIIVDKHRGGINFETELGRGTTFIVRLPIVADTK